MGFHYCFTAPNGRLCKGTEVPTLQDALDFFCEDPNYIEWIEDSQGFVVYGKRPF